MSLWTYVNGHVTVCPVGNGQRAMDFVLGSVIDHLPRVTGSEGDMHVEIVRREGHDSSQNSDEFGMSSNLGRSSWGGRGQWFEEQSTYDLLLQGALRDREYVQTLREFCKWMDRLSKRVRVEDMLVRVSGFRHAKVFDGAGHWGRNFQDWSWVPEGFKFRKGNYGEVYDARHHANWRYSVMPQGDANWTEYLVNLLPSGTHMAESLDFMFGNLEWFEYGQSPDEVGKSMDELDGMITRAEQTRCALFELAEDLRRNPLG